MGETIVYSGVTIDLDVAEDALRSRDDVVDAVAVGVSDNFLGKALQVYVVLAPGVKPDNDCRKAMLADVGGRIGGVKPRALRFVTAIPHRTDGSAAHDVVAAVVMGDDVDASDIDDPASIDAIPRRSVTTAPGFPGSRSRRRLERRAVEDPATVGEEHRAGDVAGEIAGEE